MIRRARNARDWRGAAGGGGNESLPVYGEASVSEAADVAVADGGAYIRNLGLHTIYIGNFPPVLAENAGYIFQHAFIETPAAIKIFA